MNTTQLPCCRPLRGVLVDVTVEAIFHVPSWVSGKGQEAVARHLTECVNEFEKFLKDHRSQDRVNLDVRRVYQDLCSACRAQWETYEDDGCSYCATCGVGVAAPSAPGVQDG